MPVQKSKSALASMLGDKARKSYEEHKAEEPRLGIVNLPPGISGGVAQLVMAKWDTHKEGNKNAGKPYVTFQAIVKAPKEFKDIPLEGQRANITIPLYDTTSGPQPRKCRGEPGTIENWIREVQDEIKKLGIDTSGTTFDDFEDLLKALEQEKPHTRFSTRGWTPPKNAQNPNPDEMVFTQFDGRCEYHDIEANGAVQDATGQAPATTSANGEGDSTPPFDDGAKTLQELAELAASDEEGAGDAQARLKQSALDAGVEEEAIDTAAGWAEVVELIEAAQAAGGEGAATEPEAAAEPEPPSKGENWYWNTTDPKTKKKRKIEVEILTSDPKRRGCTIKSLDTKKPIVGSDKKPLLIKWDSLTPVE